MVAVEVLELGVGDEVAFVEADVAFVGEEDLVGVEEEGVAGSGNSLGWCRVDTMVERKAGRDTESYSFQSGILVRTEDRCSGGIKP